MALRLGQAANHEDAYLGGLSEFLNRTSPLLLERDRWGFGVLMDAFGIPPRSSLYAPAGFSEARLAPILARGQEMLEGSRDRDGFLGGVGYDFSALAEPYKTELKAFFAWRLSRLANRSHGWHVHTVRLLEFCADLAARADAANAEVPKRLIDFGHPIQDGGGNGSTALRDVMERWLAGKGLSTAPQSQVWLTKARNGRRTLDEKAYGGRSSMPANNLVFTLLLLREKFKPLEQRDLILFEDVFPADQVPATRHAEAIINFFRIRLPWLRDAARRFMLDKIGRGELSSSSMTGYITSMKRIEDCLVETQAVPGIQHITQEFLDHTLLAWGNGRKLAGKNWYAVSFNMLNWACSYLPDKGWPPIKFDKRNLRKVDGEWPGGRGYQARIQQRMVPEEVVERIFQRIETLPEVCRRLLIIVRYTGMRSIDLHKLAFDCLRCDPDDDRFMLLTFYQSKVKCWNTKPLLKEDAAHALVIQVIEDQRRTVLAAWGKPTEYLFPTRRGDAETSLQPSYTRSLMARWVCEQSIHDKDGKIYAFGWHGFRHFYGTELALAGHDIVLIQMELGHSSVDMSMVYVNQRLQLKKKALLEKGGGKFIDIKGQVDETMATLAMRKDAALAVDVPGGLCALPGQLGDWCEHNRACLTCLHFRADADQLAFFDRERASITRAIARLTQEAADLRREGRGRMAEIGEMRVAHHEILLVNLTTIITSITAEGSYRGDTRRYQRPACRSGREAPPQAPRR